MGYFKLTPRLSNPNSKCPHSTDCSIHIGFIYLHAVTHCDEFIFGKEAEREVVPQGCRVGVPGSQELVLVECNVATSLRLRWSVEVNKRFEAPYLQNNQTLIELLA